MQSSTQSDQVIVVLGYHQFEAGGAHGISTVCRAGVRLAERRSRRQRPLAVVFTGWSSNGSPTEAEQMRDLWKGPTGLPLLCEPNATNTAENATETLRVVTRIPGVKRITVVCSFRHIIRVRYFFSTLYQRHGIRTELALVWRPLPPLRIFRDELGGITRMFRDRKSAERKLRSA